MPWWKTSPARLIFNLCLALAIGALLIIFTGNNPLESYYYLFKGTFTNRLSLGGTLEKWVPLTLTALAFAVSVKVAIYNVGVEGEFYLGALASTWVAVTFATLPAFVGIPLAIVAAMLVAMLWVLIPTLLKIYLAINEICTCILLNYVAIFLTSYFVNGPFSGNSGVAQSPPIPSQYTLAAILPPSRAHTGIFIVVLVYLVLIWLFHRHPLGFKIKQVGENPHFARYAGYRVTRVTITAMLISGALGGIAGCLEVFGIYKVFLDNFSLGTAFDGMLISLISGNDILRIPLYSLLVSALKQGALSLDRYTSVPKAIVDIIIVIFILLASLPTVSQTVRRRKPAAPKPHRESVC